MGDLLIKDAETLESVAHDLESGSWNASGAGYGSALRAVAERLRASAPSAAPDAAAAAAASSPAAQIAAMAASCDECRAAVTGASPANNNDLLRHDLEHHARKLAELGQAASAATEQPAE
jgi:hypothetical protein